MSQFEIQQLNFKCKFLMLLILPSTFFPFALFQLITLGNETDHSLMLSTKAQSKLSMILIGMDVRNMACQP